MRPKPAQEAANLLMIHRFVMYVSLWKTGELAFSNIDKVLVFNTTCINIKTTRDSGGVQVLKSKRTVI